MREKRLTVQMILKQIGKDTEKFLDGDMQDGILDEITLSYGGKSVEIPLELADINQLFCDFLSELNQTMKEYE